MRKISLPILRDGILDRLVRLVDWEYLFWLRVRIRYRQSTGKALNYKCPQTLSDKLMWLTRYWRHPLKKTCADKYLVRDYVKSKGLGKLLIPLVAVYDNADDIDFTKLPKRYILKCNHASGWNFIVNNDFEYDSEKIRNIFRDYLKRKYSNEYGEIHYKDIKPKIVCEELISDTAPTEYQFWCVNGEPDSILVCRKNYSGSYDSFSYSCDFNQLFERKDEIKNDGVLQRPSRLNDMLEYSRILSADFPFVRTDFYETAGKIYFAELTFTPDRNYLRKYLDVFHNRLASKLNINKIEKIL